MENDDYQGEQSTFELEERPFKPHLGSNCVFVFRNGQPLITIGPHWPLSLFLFVAIIVGTYFINGVVVIHRSLLLRILTTLSGVYLSSIFAVTVLKNPGINTAWTRQPYVDGSDACFSLGNCKACNVPRESGQVHCYDCDICVRKQDHHCPWTGKCVGGGNMLPFQLFICGLLTFFVVNLAVLLI